MKTWHFVIRGSITTGYDSTEDQIKLDLEHYVSLSDIANYVEIDLEEGED